MTTKNEKKAKEVKVATLDEALFGFQSENIVIPRNGKGSINGREYRYATLDDTINTSRLFLQKHGLTFTQIPDGENLKTQIIHVATREKIESSLPLGNPNSSQDLGARITYLRRYSLTALLGLSTEDDVDATGSQNAPKVVAPKAPTKDLSPVKAEKNEVQSDLQAGSPAFEKAKGAVLSAKTIDATEMIAIQIEKSVKLNDDEKSVLRDIISNQMTELKKILD